MTYLRLAARRLFRSVPFLVTLLCMAILVPAALLCGRTVAEPTAGFAANGTGEQTERLLSSLTDSGFIRYETEEALRTAISTGEVSCGAVLPADMEQRITSAKLDNSVLFLTAPTTILPDLFRISVVASVLSVASPYFSRPILEQLAPDSDLMHEIVSLYYEEQKNDTGFVFDVETVDGIAPEELDFGISFALTLLSVFLFALPLLQGCRLSSPQYLALKKRIGSRTAYRTVFLPEAAVSLLTTSLVLVLCFPVAALVSGKADFADKLIPALATAILLALLGLCLPLVFRRADALQMLLVPVLLLTIVLCPLFVDIGTFLPATRILRLFLPTYWIFLL